MTTKYKADFTLKEVKPVEIIRETDANVWLPNGRREEKYADNHTYCDNHKHAVECVVASLQGKIMAAKQLAFKWEVELTKFTHKYNVQ